MEFEEDTLVPRQGLHLLGRKGTCGAVHPNQVVPHIHVGVIGLEKM